MEPLSKSNIRGLLYLLPMLAAVLLLSVVAERRSRMPLREAAADAPTEKVSEHDAETSPPVMRAFDPNTVSLRELLRMGVPRYAAVSLIKWRQAGKVFAVREEVLLCNGMTDSIYFALEPYINIGKEYALAARDSRRSAAERHYEPFLVDTVGVATLRRAGLTRRQAEAFVRYRDMRGRLRDMDEVRECYTLPSDIADSMERYIIFSEPEPPSKVDINKADSAALLSVRGIGAKSVGAIMDYRRRLGGFYSVDQLSEIDCITESNFEIILQQICCDSCVISKIDINFATPQTLKEHPYISDRALRRITKTRQLKGGWHDIEEMTEEEIFTRQEAERLRPYLRFRSEPTE